LAVTKNLHLRIHAGDRSRRDEDAAVREGAIERAVGLEAKENHVRRLVGLALRPAHVYPPLRIDIDAHVDVGIEVGKGSLAAVGEGAVDRAIVAELVETIPVADDDAAVGGNGGLRIEREEE